MVTARFGTKRLPSERDGAGRVGRKCLLKLKGQSTAHFELGPSQTSCAIMHGTLEGIWFFICGPGGDMARARPGSQGRGGLT